MRHGRAAILPALLLALVGALVLAPGSTQAGPGGQARLLVKCSAAHLPDILAALHGHDVWVYDIDGQRELKPAPLPPELPALPDARRVMQEVVAVLATVRDESGAPALAVTSFSAGGAGAGIELDATEEAAPERAARALAANAYLKGRSVDASVERLERVGSSWTAVILLELSLEEIGAPPVKSRTRAISSKDVYRAALPVQMQYTYASPERLEPWKGRQDQVLSREYTFGPSTMEQLTKLLFNLSTGPAGFTVIELRWSRDGRDPDRVRKSTLRLAVPIPLPR